MSGAHKHWFTALWESPSRSAIEHVHPCIEDVAGGASCDWALVGLGRSCDGNVKTHRRVNLVTGRIGRSRNTAPVGASEKDVPVPPLRETP